MYIYYIRAVFTGSARVSALKVIGNYKSPECSVSTV